MQTLMENKHAQRLYFFMLALLSFWYLLQFRQSRGTWFLIVTVGLLVALLALALSFLSRSITPPLFKLRLHQSFLWGVALILVIAAALLPFNLDYQIFLHRSGCLLFLFWMVGVGAFLLSLSQPSYPFAHAFLFLVILGGFIYKLASFVPDVQPSPFALGWSEGSRYFNASLFFSKKLYGYQLDLPVLHPSRYLLQSIPFVFGRGNILLHRLWQVLLWICITALGSFVIIRRLNINSGIKKLALILWLFLFFFQGAVYYYLMVCVILVLIGYHPKKPIRILVFVILASIWAGLSRINWFPLPACLAVTLYFLEVPYKDGNWFKYLKYPILWCLSGGIFSLLTKRVYTLLSGNDPELFNSSFTSGMLWSRLLPNSTYPLGILIGITIVCLPLALLMLQKLISRRWKPYWNWMRSIGLFTILSMFLIGGIIVSVKIGGGGDLHNLDAFLVLWVVVGLYMIFDHYAMEKPVANEEVKLPGYIFFLASLLPVFMAFESLPSWKFISPEAQEKDVSLMQSAMDVINNEPGKILFISERQLLTFNDIKDVDMYPEYEKVFLMEMAMSNNRKYLERFYELLSVHEFSGIILDSLTTNIQDPSKPFWSENNEWVYRVLIPILDYYEPVYSLQNGTVNLLIPRGQPVLLDTILKLEK